MKNLTVLGDQSKGRKYRPDLAQQLNEKSQSLTQSEEVMPSSTVTQKGSGQRRHIRKPDGGMREMDLSNMILLPGKEYTEGSVIYSYADTLVFAKRLHPTNWTEAHYCQHKRGAHMLTPRQFVDFLKILRSGNAYDGLGNKIEESKVLRTFSTITTIRDLDAGEWLDMTVKYVNNNPPTLGVQLKHKITVNESLVPQLNTVPFPRYFRFIKQDIDLSSWLDTANIYGLPHFGKNAFGNDLYYDSSVPIDADWENEQRFYFGTNEKRVTLGTLPEKDSSHGLPKLFNKFGVRDAYLLEDLQ